MRVINLLPWRERLYKRRYWRLITLLSVLLAACVVWGIFDYLDRRQGRNEHNARIADLQATLVQLEQDHSRIQHASTGLIDIARSAQSIQFQHRRHQAWLQSISEWQWLSAQVDIAEITLQDGKLLLRADSNDVHPLRVLMHQSPQWLLEQIGLDAQARFSFLISQTLRTEEGI